MSSQDDTFKKLSRWDFTVLKSKFDSKDFDNEITNETRSRLSAEQWGWINAGNTTREQKQIIADVNSAVYKEMKAALFKSANWTEDEYDAAYKKYKKDNHILDMSDVYASVLRNMIISQSFNTSTYKGGKL